MLCCNFLWAVGAVAAKLGEEEVAVFNTSYRFVFEYSISFVENGNLKTATLTCVTRSDSRNVSPMFLESCGLL